MLSLALGVQQRGLTGHAVYFHQSSLIEREENHNTQMLHIFAAKPISPSAGTGFWSLLLHLKEYTNLCRYRRIII
jgi:hypothetical protein